MENNLKKILGFFENQLDNPFLWTIVAVIIIAIIIFIVIQIRKAKKSWSRPASTGPKKPSLLSRIWEPIDLWLTLKIERIKFNMRERHQRKINKNQNTSNTNEEYYGIKFKSYNSFAWKLVFWLLPLGAGLWLLGFENIGKIVLLFSILHLMFGQKRVTVNQYLVIDFLGIPLTVINGTAGMILIGCTTTKFNASQVQTQYPGNPEDIFWDDEKKDLPSGKVRPVRFSTKTPTGFDPKTETDPLKMFRYTIAVSWTVTWQIKKSEVIKFWKNVGSENEAISRMRDQSQETLKEEYGKLTPSEVLEKTKKTSKKLERDLEKLTGDGDDPGSGWGVNIVGVNIVEDNLGHTTTAEQAKATQAQYKLNAKLKENLGVGDEERQKLIGRADGTKKIQENLKTEEGRLAARLTLASETLKNSDYTIVPDSEIFKTLANVGQFLNRPQKSRNNKKQGGNNGNNP